MNTAGISTHMNVADMPVAAWNEMIAINLRGVFPGTRVVLPGMIKRR